MKLKEKWIHDYVSNIDISNIKWIKLNFEQLMNFIMTII